MQQTLLFDLPASERPLPEGLCYEPDFLERHEEAWLLDLIEQLPLAEAQYKGFTARRRVMSYGGTYDFDAHRLDQAAPLIKELQPLRDKVARWAGVRPQELAHALVAQYPPGAPLGWHRDVPDFERVYGVSLGAPAVLRFRPYPPVQPKPRDIRRLVAEPRSVYAMVGPARWAWQHSVAPVDALRWSITFRTLRQ